MNLGQLGKQAPSESTKASDSEQLIRKYAGIALVVGVVPIPLLDMAVLSALQVQMALRLSKDYEVEFSDELAKSIIASLLGAGGSYVAANSSARLLLRFVPVGGQLVCATSTALFAGASTYAVGRVLVQHFESGGTMLTFDPDKVRDYYSRQFERGKEEVGQSFVGVRP